MTKKEHDPQAAPAVQVLERMRMEQGTPAESSRNDLKDQQREYIRAVMRQIPDESNRVRDHR